MPKLRGIIVVDASELITLGAKLLPRSVIPDSPLAKLKHKTGTYLDLLIALSEHGYKIIVPGTVLTEATTWLPDGTDIGKKAVDIDPAAIANRNKFGELVATGKLPNIITTRPDQDAADTQYGKRMQQLINASKETHFTKSRVQKIYRQYKCYERNKPQHDNFGELDAIAIIKKEVAMNTDTPIFFVASDGNARKALTASAKEWGADAAINTLTSGGFIRALAYAVTRNNKLKTVLRGLGLESSIQKEYHAHWDHIRTIDRNLPENPIGEDYYCDCPLGHPKNNSMPFMQSLFGLAKELHGQQNWQDTIKGSQGGERKR